MHHLKKARGSRIRGKMERIEWSIIAGLGGAVVDGGVLVVVFDIVGGAVGDGGAAFDLLAPIAIYMITIFFLHRSEGPE